MKTLLFTLLVSSSVPSFAIDNFLNYEILDKQCATAYKQRICVGDSIAITNKDGNDGGVRKVGLTVKHLIKLESRSKILNRPIIITSVIYETNANRVGIPTYNVSVDKIKAFDKANYSQKCHQNYCVGDKIYPGDTGFYPENSWKIVGINPKTKEVLSEYELGGLYLSRFDQIIRD